MNNVTDYRGVDPLYFLTATLTGMVNLSPTVLPHVDGSRYHVFGMDITEPREGKLVQSVVGASIVETIIPGIDLDSISQSNIKEDAN
jgi:hypothetical protein